MLTITKNNAPVIPKGDFDNTPVVLTLVKDQYDKNPQTVESTLAELKAMLVEDAKREVQHKSHIYGLMPCSYQADAPSKREEYAIARHMLVLDFDQDPSIDVIQQQLKDYTYFAWTTHSHGVKGNRYRVVIPFTQAPTVTEWKQHYVPRLLAWFEQQGFAGANAVDTSCLTFGQIGFLPAINPLVGAVNLYVNDVGTVILDLVKVLPELTAEELAHAHREYQLQSIKWTPSTKQIHFLIGLLARNPQLQRIDANPTTENKGVNRKTIAAALQSVGATFDDFAQLDRVMAKLDSNTTAASAWRDAEAKRSKHAGVLFKLLSRAERRLCGLSRTAELTVTSLHRAEFDKTEEIDFLSRELYGTEKRVLVKADMGTGKNYLWTQHKNTEDDRVIVLAPLKTIVGQQGSDNKVQDATNITFTYDQSKKALDLVVEGVIVPEKTTLVIDECHNLLLASYRLKALSNVERLLAYNFKQVIFQSATIEADSFDTFYTFDARYCYKKRTAPALKYSLITVGGTINTTSSILKLIEASIAENKKVLCLWNNKDQLEGMGAILKPAGVVSEIVSAERVRQQHQEAWLLANDADYKMDEVQVLFGTTSLVEGVSIKDELDTGVVIIVGKEPPQYIKQMCGRFRAAKTVECYHIALPEEGEEPVNFEEWLDAKRMDLVLRQELAASLNRTYETFDMFDHAAFIRSQDCARSAHQWAAAMGLVFDEEKRVYVDSKFGNLFLTSEIEQIEFYSDKEIAIEVMERLGFSYQPLAKGSQFKASEEDRLTIRELQSRTLAVQRARRAESAKPIIEAVERLTKEFGEHDFDINAVQFLLGVEDIKPLDEAFYKEVLEAVAAQLKRASGADGVLAVIDRMVKKQTNAAVELLKADSERSNHSVYAVLQRDYPSGTVLTSEQQRDMVKEIVVYEMEQLRKIRPAFSNERLFEEAVKAKVLKQQVAKGKIKYENGVVVDMERPLKFLSANYLPMESKVEKQGGRSVRVGVVL